MNTHGDDLRDLPFGALLARLGDQLGRLVRNELALFKAEMGAVVKRVVAAVICFAVAAGLGLFALIALTIALINALTLVVPAWAAALIVAGIYLLIAVICVVGGMTSLKKIVGPKESVRSIGEDIRWATTRIKSARRSTTRAPK